MGDRHRSALNDLPRLSTLQLMINVFTISRTGASPEEQLPQLACYSMTSALSELRARARYAAAVCRLYRSRYVRLLKAIVSIKGKAICRYRNKTPSDLQNIRQMTNTDLLIDALRSVVQHHRFAFYLGFCTFLLRAMKKNCGILLSSRQPVYIRLTAESARSEDSIGRRFNKFFLATDQVLNRTVFRFRLVPRSLGPLISL